MGGRTGGQRLGNELIDDCAAEKRTWLADTHRGKRARFDAALGLALVAPRCASSASAWYLRCCDGEEEGQSGPRANVLGRFGKTTNAR